MGTAFLHCSLCQHGSHDAAIEHVGGSLNHSNNGSLIVRWIADRHEGYRSVFSNGRPASAISGAAITDPLARPATVPSQPAALRWNQKDRRHLWRPLPPIEAPGVSRHRQSAKGVAVDRMADRLTSLKSQLAD